MAHCNRCHKQIHIGETKRRLKDRFNEHCRPVANKHTVLNLLQSQNIFFLTTITLLTCYLFLSNSPNLIVTLYAKLERHTSSIEIKLFLFVIGEMRHEHFSRLSSSLFMLLSQITHCYITCFRFLHCNVIYLAHAYILYFQISNCNVFV